MMFEVYWFGGWALACIIAMILVPILWEHGD